MIQTNDLTYYYPILNLWALIEIASGVLAASLPYSPTFVRSLKDSNLWSGLGNSGYFSTRSKTKSKPKYHSLPYGTELTTTSTKGRKERSTQASHWTETSQNLQIMRTIHIATTEETGPAPTMPEPPH